MLSSVSFVSRRSFSISHRLATNRLKVKEALNQALDEEMQKDERVFLIGLEIGQNDGPFQVSKGLAKKYGEKRVIDTPISEMGFAGLATGAAFAGLRPVCEFMRMDFTLQAVDHIINSSAKTFYMSAGFLNVPIVFRGPNGSFPNCGAQHSQCFASWYSNCPGLKVLSPYDSEDAKGLLKAAIRDPDPVVFLESVRLYDVEFPVSDEVLDSNFVLPIGKAKIQRPGNHVTIVSHSKEVEFSLEAAEELAGVGIEAEVINLRSIRPLDMETILKSVQKTKHLVTVEGGWPQSGVGSEIAARVVEHETIHHLASPIIRVTSSDIPMPVAPSLENAALPKAKDIVKAVKQSLKLE